MKKLYSKGTVHPSPPIISDHLSFLPAAILTLTAALSPEDREVLAYLISCSNNSSSSSFQGHRKSTGNNKNKDHPPLFTCDCFRCYMSYWVKWDASPNRQLIHEIIDAFEDHEMLLSQKKITKNNKKDRKKRSSGNYHKKSDLHQLKDQQLQKAESSESVEENIDDDGEVDDDHESCNDKGEGEGEGDDKGSVRSFVSYIGETIWGVWG